MTLLISVQKGHTPHGEVLNMVPVSLTQHDDQSHCVHDGSSINSKSPPLFEQMEEKLSKSIVLILNQRPVSGVQVNLKNLTFGNFENHFLAVTL